MFIHIYHLWLKEYSDVYWLGFLFLFMISILPFLIKALGDWRVVYLQSYNVFFNFIIASTFSGTAHGLTGNNNIAIALFYAFGIGYSLLYFRKDDWRKESERLFAFGSLALFALLISLTAISQLRYF